MKEHEQGFYPDNRAHGRHAIYLGAIDEAIERYREALKSAEDRKSVLLELHTLVQCGHLAANDVIKALDLTVPEFDDI